MSLLLGLLTSLSTKDEAALCGSAASGPGQNMRSAHILWGLLCVSACGTGDMSPGLSHLVRPGHPPHPGHTCPSCCLALLSCQLTIAGDWPFPGGIMGSLPQVTFNSCGGRCFEGDPCCPFLLYHRERGSGDWQSSPLRAPVMCSMIKCRTETQGKRKAKLTVVSCGTSQSLDVLVGTVGL